MHHSFSSATKSQTKIVCFLLYPGESSRQNQRFTKPVNRKAANRKAKGKKILCIKIKNHKSQIKQMINVKFLMNIYHNSTVLLHCYFKSLYIFFFYKMWLFFCCKFYYLDMNKYKNKILWLQNNDLQWSSDLKASLKGHF